MFFFLSFSLSFFRLLSAFCMYDTLSPATAAAFTRAVFLRDQWNDDDATEDAAISSETMQDAAGRRAMMGFRHVLFSCHKSRRCHSYATGSMFRLM